MVLALFSSYISAKSVSCELHYFRATTFGNVFKPQTRDKRNSL